MSQEQQQIVAESSRGAGGPYETQTVGGPLVTVHVDAAVVTAMDGSSLLVKVPEGTRLWPVDSDETEFTVYVAEVGQLGQIQRKDVVPETYSKTEQEMLQTATVVLQTASQLYFEKNDFASAEELFRKSSRFRERLLGKDHPDTAIAVNGLGLCAYARDDIPTAEKYFKQCQEIRTRLLGPGHPSTASVTSNLAGMYYKSGDFSEAESLWLQSIQSLESSKGKKSPHTSGVRNNLALLYLELADFAKAEPLFVEVLDEQMKVQGESNPDTATTCNNLGLLYTGMGKYTLAKSFLNRSLSTFRNLYGEHHERIPMVLGNLAMVEEETGNLSEAEQSYRRCLEIRTGLLGSSHRDTIQSAANLGSILVRTSRTREALEILKPALVASRTNPGIHPVTAALLSTASSASLQQGDDQVALEMCEEAAAMFAQCLGESHPTTAAAFGRLADQNLRLGATEQAMAHRNRERQAVRQHLVNVVPGLIETLQQSYLTEVLRDGTEKALSHGLQLRDDPATAERSAEWLLNGKSSLQEARAAKRQIDSEAGKGLLNELNYVRRRIARLTDSFRSHSETEAELSDLREQQQTLERKLSEFRRTPESGTAWRSLTDFRKMLPENSVCINIARFRIHDFAESQSTDTRWKESHYAAWVISSRSDEAVHVIDLGPSDEIDGAVRRFRSAIVSTAAAIRTSSEEDAVSQLSLTTEPLTQRLLAPLHPFISDADEIVVCPDGELWTLPWCALSWDGKYLAERYRIRYIVSGRELFKEDNSSSPDRDSIVFADPDFDASVLSSGIRDVDLPDHRNLRAAGIHFNRLPGTAAEAAFVMPELEKICEGEVQLYSGEQATEAAFRSLVSPEILMVSTHGFALPPPTSNETETGSINGTDNPLLRCGLALAGANQSKSISEATDDGLLTGEEIVIQDLRGTRLVVLSACETGLGDIQSGEGVSGLRQAFELAGAESVIASLWQIDDMETAVIVKQFFQQLAAGRSRSAALQNAQLERIEKRRERYGAAHPFFWAAFTLTGN
ncbi:MAG: CHAT domain-containing protein [Planctomycetaceae bacterium]